MTPKAADTWQWFATLAGGQRVHERDLQTIGNVPTSLVQSFGVTSGSGTVLVEFPTGRATISGQGPDRHVHPVRPDISAAPKRPVFFRRKRTSLKTGRTEVVFRAVGFVALDFSGTPVQVNVIRIGDDGILARYDPTVGLDAARHTTGSEVILGGG